MVFCLYKQEILSEIEEIISKSFSLTTIFYNYDNYEKGTFESK